MGLLCSVRWWAWQNLGESAIESCAIYIGRAADFPLSLVFVGVTVWVLWIS